MWDLLFPYLSVFFSALMAATIVPAQSELMLAYQAHHHALERWGLFLCATTGNVLGSCMNYAMGEALHSPACKRILRLKEQSFARAAQLYNKYGAWTLLGAWIPIIGDPLTVFAGYARTPYRVFLLLVTIGKAARYAVLLWLLPA